MHQVDLDFDLSLREISKVEGSASLYLSVKAGKIIDLKFSITEWKRFYTQGVEGKPVAGVPQLVDRICGTCSNAHLLASIKALENGLHITPSLQTILLRKLLYYGLIIRDHALHLYIFGIPDLLGKSSILDLDEKNEFEHQLLHDAFDVKEVGNKLSIITGGRSVHAPYPTIGGFLKLPKLDQLKDFRSHLEKIKPAVLRLIDLYANKDAELTLKTPLTYAGLVSNDFSFLEGIIQTSDNTVIEESQFGNHLNEVIIPYSHARGFNFKGKLMITGALARLNLNKEHLHPKTKINTLKYLALFPSQNLFHNNLAQAIEILHSIDSSIDIIDNLNEIVPETPPKIEKKAGKGTGVIEAPRGTLYYSFDIDDKGCITHADIVVPTGQNQIAMEKGIHQLVQQLLNKGGDKETIAMETERLIRSFDPCMSCASHFLKIKWKE